MIVRRDITSNFTVVQNNIITSQSGLSIEARWLLIYLLSRPQDWIVRLADIQNQSGVGRDKAQRMLRELIDARWVRKDIGRSENGQWSGFDYVVMDQPEGENPAVSPQPENPEPVNPEPVNPQHTKDGKKPKTESTKNISSVDELERDFEEFWAVYPKRPNNPRRKAMKAYLKARAKKGVTKEQLLRDVGRYAASMVGHDARFIPHTSTWLNDERWGNDPDEAKAVIGAFKSATGGGNVDVSPLAAVYPTSPGDLDEVRAAVAASGGSLDQITEAARKFALLVKAERAEGFTRPIPALAQFVRFRWRDMDAYEFCRIGMNNTLTVRPRKGTRT